MSVKLIRDKGRPVLVVEVRPGEVHTIESVRESCADPQSRFTELVGLILAQAFVDDMSAIELSAQEGKGAIRLRYYGPRDDESPRWWDMIAPPLEAYAPMVKAIVEATTFAPGIEPSGTIWAEINGSLVDVSVRFQGWCEVRLDWGATTPAGWS